MVISRRAMQSILTAPRLVARNRAAAVEKAGHSRDAQTPTISPVLVPDSSICVIAYTLSVPQTPDQDAEHGPEHKQENAGQQNCQQQFIRPISCNAKKDIFRCPFAIHVSMHVSVFICIHISMDAVKPIHLLPYLPSAPQNAPGFPYAFHRTGTGPPSSACRCHIPGPVHPGTA